jgi:ABC-type branched-subunit amino acid transport system permease subunit
MTLSFLWFGAFAAAGGTSIAALTDLPSGWARREQILFWAYTTMALFLVAILLSNVINLQTGRSLHVVRGDFYPAGIDLGERQRRSIACSIGFLGRAGHIPVANAVPMGPDRCYEITDSDHVRRPRRFLDTFLFALAT